MVEYSYMLPHLAGVGPRHDFAFGESPNHSVSCTILIIKNAAAKAAAFFMVEHSGFEPLTSTLPV